MHTDLLFINRTPNSQEINGQTRRKIKQHVMRNIGITRRRPRGHAHGSKKTVSRSLESGKHSQLQTQPNDTGVFKGSVLEPRHNAFKNTALDLVSPKALPSSNALLPRKKDDMVVVLCTPLVTKNLSFAPESFARMLHHYEGSTDISVVVMREFWAPHVFLDNATFYTAMSLFYTSVKLLHPEVVPTPGHVSDLAATSTKAIHELRNNLRDPHRRHSEGTIAAIAASICQALIQEDDQAVEVHLKGLKALVNARGGLQSLKSNILLQYLVSYGDVVGAYHANCEPTFPMPRQPSLLGTFCKNPSVPELPRRIVKEWRSIIPSHKRYTELFEDLILYITRLREHMILPIRAEMAFRVATSSGCFVTLLHRFQSEYRSAQDGTSNDFVLECVRIAVPLVLSEPRRKCGILPSFNKTYIKDLKSIMMSGRSHWAGLELLKLWVCTVAAAEAFPDTKPWFENEMHVCVEGFSELEQAQLLHDVREMLLDRDQSFGVSLSGQ